MLEGKTVVVGVCGGIAAYKVVDVVSRLKKLKAEVNVIMTKNAVEFVAPLTFRSISHNPVVSDMFTEPGEWDIKHISLAAKADLLLVAPATANIIGKIANGIADDMLTTTVMAAKAPVMLLPAMNSAMYENPVVQANLDKLKTAGYMVIEPCSGMMACGTTGKGRLPEPEDIVNEVVNLLNPKRDFQGIKLLVTAGPTREAIDPVRYISNHSSGKMGYAIASAASQRGAEVVLISGPVHIAKPENVNIIDVITAEEMYGEVMKHYYDCRVIIHVAAVADYKCADISGHKIKKSGSSLNIQLVKNPDIAYELGKVKKDRIHIGTCAETDHLVDNAKLKLGTKNFDMIMANDITMEGAGFGVDTNIVKFIRKDGKVRDLPLMSKKEVAHNLLDEVVDMLKA